MIHYTFTTSNSAVAARIKQAAATAATIAIVAIALGACSKAMEPNVTGSLPFDGYRQRHPIVLKENAETIDIPIATNVGSLSPGAAQTVSRFGSTAVERGTRSVTILVPTGSANEKAALTMAREVDAALKEGGVAPQLIVRRPYRVMDRTSEAPIRIMYPRLTAVVPHACGQWPDQITTDADNTEYWNFGCAMQANLAAMVADPTDLVTPRGMDQADATRRTTVIKKYREGTPTQTQGAPRQLLISDVGN